MSEDDEKVDYRQKPDVSLLNICVCRIHPNTFDREM